MRANEKLLRPVYEVNYLRAENVARYRLIIRYFFTEYEKIHYWLHKEDVYAMMMQYEEMAGYTMEQCQQDLQSLVEWGNLIAIQDSQKVKTIEDFKNRQYRYQLSEYTVEIERMTLRLENLGIEGASLEPTLLEKLLASLKDLNSLDLSNEAQVHQWLNTLMSDFIRLNQNYQDYIKTLNSAKAEELMKTTAFLFFKDKLINYLRTFVMAMQKTGTLIALALEEIDDQRILEVLKQATAYEFSIPRIDVELQKEVIYENYLGKWQSMYQWFIGEGEQSEMDRLNDITNDIIRKMTRYAAQIIEMSNRGSNRKEQYYHLADIFMKCRDLNEAHCLSAYVFGVADCLHLDHIRPRTTDNIHQGVYEDPPRYLKFDPHSRMARNKTIRKPAKDYTLEKRMKQFEIQAEQEKQKRRMAELIHDQRIDFRYLPLLDTMTRRTLLEWLAKGLEENNAISRTEDGSMYTISKEFADEMCVIHCEDGDFIMPGFQIVFLREASGDE